MALDPYGRTAAHLRCNLWLHGCCRIGALQLAAGAALPVWCCPLPVGHGISRADLASFPNGGRSARLDATPVCHGGPGTSNAGVAATTAVAVRWHHHPCIRTHHRVGASSTYPWPVVARHRFSHLEADVAAHIAANDGANANTGTNSDPDDGANANANANANAYAYAYARTNANADTDTDTDTDAYAYAYANARTNANTDTDTDTDTDTYAYIDVYIHVLDNFVFGLELNATTNAATNATTNATTNPATNVQLFFDVIVDELRNSSLLASL
jgi:hypothetical protein